MSAKISTEEEATIYECAFDFTVCKPKSSQFIGKGGVTEITTDRPLTEEQINNLKADKSLEANIARFLATTMNQKNIFSVTVKSITLKNS